MTHHRFIYLLSKKLLAFDHEIFFTKKPDLNSLKLSYGEPQNGRCELKSA
jgi:hypothetical protein